MLLTVILYYSDDDYLLVLDELPLFCHSPESIIPNPCCIGFYHKSPQLNYRSLNKASKLFEIRLVAIAFDF
jgi:hypothetical protein